MGLAAVVAAFAGRLASRWYGLLLAAVVTLAFDPRAWQDVGWQLSFAAVAGIFVLARPLARLLRALPEPVRTGAALTVAATLATAPLMAFHFERVSAAALPANLAALPAIALVMWIGMLSAAAAQVWIVPAELLNGLNGFLLAYVAAVAHWGARLPGAVVELRISGPAQLALAYAAFAGALGTAWRARAVLRRRAALFGACALVAAAGGALLLPGTTAVPREFTVTFLDVGQGDAILVQAPGGYAALVDGGPAEADVVSDLRARGVTRLDLVVLTHAQADHQGGLEEVLAEFPVDSCSTAPIPRTAPTTSASWPGPGGAGRRWCPPRPVSVQARPDSCDSTCWPQIRARPCIWPRPEHAGRGAPEPPIAPRRPADRGRRERGHRAAPPRPVEVLKVAHHGSADEGMRASAPAAAPGGGRDPGRRREPLRASASRDARRASIRRPAGVSHRSRRSGHAGPRQHRPRDPL